MESNAVFLEPNTQIGDHRVLHYCASGGMGDVYKVENPLLQEVFAIKVMRARSDGCDALESTQRFLQEARTTSRLRHGNIVTLHTMGVLPGRSEFYVLMDYVGLSPMRREEILNGSNWFQKTTDTHGGERLASTSLSLEDVLHLKGPLEEKIALRLFFDIASALNYAHNFGDGIVHCDLKPSNILLREDGHAVVTDFGIARLQNAAEGNEENVVSGTPDYMAPEQFDPYSKLTAAVDIYAFGVLCYRMLTGYFPVGVWVRPSEFGLSVAWNKLIERCVEKEPERRWSSMTEILMYLRNFSEHERLLKVKQRNKKPKKEIFVAIALVILAIFFGVFCFIKQTKRLNLKETIVVTPEAFIDQNLRAAVLNPMYAGSVVYSNDAPTTLPISEFSLPHISRIGIPAQVEKIAPEFWDAFPRLEYIACHPNNKTYFAKDGILYLRADNTRPLVIPPKLYGEIHLPDTVNSVVYPWHDGVTLTPTRLLSYSGAYDKPVVLISKQPIQWIPKKYQ